MLPSAGRATDKVLDNNATFKISIHALRGEGDRGQQRRRHRNAISIHALRGEGDALFVRVSVEEFPISIHALRGEGDPRFSSDAALS